MFSFSIEYVFELSEIVCFSFLLQNAIQTQIYELCRKPDRLTSLQHFHVRFMHPLTQVDVTTELTNSSTWLEY